MYGWRGRIAHLAPSRGDTMVHEFYRVAPKGVMLFNTTGTIRNLRKEDIEARLQYVEAAAKDVATDKVDLIIVGGGPVATAQGYGSAERIAAQLTEACGVPCVMSIQFQVQALQAVGSRRPVIASPYPKELDEQLVEYLGKAGFDVQGAKGLGIVRNAELGLLPEYAALRIGREAVAMAPRADAILLPCSRWPTLDAVVLLEQELGLPVVSATIADFYGAFKFLNIRDTFEGYGSLLRSLAPRTVEVGHPEAERVAAVV
jgi:maleate cis-trans isomerase